MSTYFESKATPILVIIGWLIIGLYFGSGGITRLENDNLIKKTSNSTDTSQVIYNKVSYKNKNELISQLEHDEMDTIYPWVDSIPSFVAYLITACAFGLLGSITHIIYQIVLKDIELAALKYWSSPVLGTLTGMLVLGISFVLPNTLFSTDAEIKPSTLMFICLFCGLYSVQFYKRMENSFTKIFK